MDFSESKIAIIKSEIMKILVSEIDTIFLMNPLPKHLNPFVTHLCITM